MKNFSVFFCIAFLFLSNCIFGQTIDKESGYYFNLKPAALNCLLDSVNTTDISFGLSLRKLKRQYTGFCVKVRRSSDNTEMDIGFNGDGLLDTNAIIKFKGNSSVFVSVWYDQSGKGRHATQTNRARQPELQFEKHRKFPAIQFDGINDGLVINTSIQILTQSGADGSVFYVGNSTNRSQWTFGSKSQTNNSNRWSVHISWSNDNVYFDPGFCCNSTRFFNNISRRDSVDQISFIRTSNQILIRQNEVLKASGAHTTGSCTANVGFGIGAGWQGNGFHGNANNFFNEMIMFKKAVSGADLGLLESNQVSYWKI